MNDFRKRIVLAFLAMIVAGPASASVLPEDRTDVMYHLYDGGGVAIDGPSVLVRKQVGNSLSFVGNYYVDMVSSASIDVVSTASPYTEERKQWSFGADYLRGNTTMRMSYTSSVESDFDASTYSFSVSQDMFAGLTTLTLAYARGDDIVGDVTDEEFERENDRQHYAVGLTQIFTRNLIATLNFETITDEGFLNNPYRSVRYLNPADTGGRGYSYEKELYPSTRTSNAVGLRAKYRLPWRAALEAEYRYFIDTWDIESHTASIGYTQPWGPWTFSAKYRHHNQTGASFFSDLFTRSEQTNFRARDKELSPLTSGTLHLAASYEFIDDIEGWNFIKKGTVTVAIDELFVDYDEFRDVTAGPLGSEPLYELESSVLQVYFSFWY